MSKHECQEVVLLCWLMSEHKCQKVVLLCWLMSKHKCQKVFLLCWLMSDVKTHTFWRVCFDIGQDFLTCQKRRLRHQTHMCLMSLRHLRHETHMMKKSNHMSKSLAPPCTWWVMLHLSEAWNSNTRGMPIPGSRLDVDEWVIRHTATHCNTLQHTATHYNILQHTATHRNETRRWWMSH